jgi:hypothetical protein
MVNTKITITSMIIISFLITSVSALAISSAYGNEGLRISAGETKEISLIIQNIVGPEDINVQGEILNGTDIARLSDPSDIYFVPLGSKIKANISVTAPSDAKLGDNYVIRLAFTTVTVGGSGTFGFGSSIGQNINVIVGTDGEIELAQKKAENKIIYIIIGIIVILAIIIYVLKKKKIF